VKGSNSRNRLIFLSYSQADASWLDKLRLFLKPFERSGALELWSDQYIQVGTEWRREIDVALSRTRVSVVLLSQQYLASDFITGVELPALINLTDKGEATIVVVPVSASIGPNEGWSGQLRRFQWPITTPLQSLAGHARNRALQQVAQSIADAVGVTSSESVISHDPPAPLPCPPPLVPTAHRGELHGVPEPPPHLMNRPQQLEALRQTLLSGTRAVVGVSGTSGRIGVHGLGGVGKTVLAQLVATDDVVRSTFPDGIFWLTFGQQPQIAAL